MSGDEVSGRKRQEIKKSQAWAARRRPKLGCESMIGPARRAGYWARLFGAADVDLGDWWDQRSSSGGRGLIVKRFPRQIELPTELTDAAFRNLESPCNLASRVP
jgi:hypothetical protein